MNFFGGGQEQPQGRTLCFAAKTEMEMYTDLFNKIADNVFSKCTLHRQGSRSLFGRDDLHRSLRKYPGGSQQRVGEEVLQRQTNSRCATTTMVNTQNTMGSKIHNRCQIIVTNTGLQEMFSEPPVLGSAGRLTPSNSVVQAKSSRRG
jgi:hypothetical protein